MIVRSPNPLPPHPDAMINWLDHWASVAPDQIYLAERKGEGWRTVTFAEARQAAGRVAQALIDRGLRPVAILSGNSVDHALIGLGAMIAGIPYAPVSPPYSLIAKEVRYSIPSLSFPNHRPIHAVPEPEHKVDAEAERFGIVGVEPLQLTVRSCPHIGVIVALDLAENLRAGKCPPRTAPPKDARRTRRR